MNTTAQSSLFFTTFKDALGWTGLRWRGNRLQRLTFAHRSSGAAKKELLAWQGPKGTPLAKKSDFSSALLDEHHDLVMRLEGFARMLVDGPKGRQGQLDDFLDIEIDKTGWTKFRSAVLEACRTIPPGEPLTYMQLATLAGSPRACRAVGNIMASNPTPLLTP